MVKYAGTQASFIEIGKFPQIFLGSFLQVTKSNLPVTKTRSLVITSVVSVERLFDG